MFQFIQDVNVVPELLQGVGVFGFLLYVGSFWAVQNGKICGNGIIYPLLQVAAALCVLLSLLVAFNLPSFLIQISYVAIGLYGVLLRRCTRSGGANPKTPIGTPA